MIHALAPLLLTSLALAAVPVENGTQLTYQGVFDAEKGDPFLTRKTFDLTLLVTNVTEDEATVLWMTDEQGLGGWQWPDRFGRFTIDAKGRPSGEDLPSLLHQRPEGSSVVPLGVPMVAWDKPLQVGSQWDEHRLTYEVKGLGRRGDTPAWRIEVSNPYGRVRTMWVDENGPVVTASKQRVFIGQGEQHELRYELKERATLAADELASATAALDQLLELRERLDHPPRSARVDWSKEQLETLKQQLPAVAKPQRPALLARILSAANEDAKAQKDRTSAVDALANNVVGKSLGELKLADLSGKPVDPAMFQGKAVVLHFWGYQDSPLEEPYGQVGYLDFLHRRMADQPVAVVGVVVDDRPNGGDPSRVVQSAKKLRSFMNLGYPLLLDDGALKQVGDPRVAEAKLPLFVVIDRAGKVVEYHVGYYDVDRDQGLKQLETTARGAAK